MSATSMVSTLFTCSLLLFSSSADSSDEKTPLVRPIEHSQMAKFVLDGIVQNESRIRNFQTHFTIEYEESIGDHPDLAHRMGFPDQPRYPPKDDSPTTKREFRVTWEGSRLASELTMHRADGSSELAVMVFDGEKHKNFRPKHKRGLVSPRKQWPSVQGIYRFTNLYLDNDRTMGQVLADSTIENVELTRVEDSDCAVLNVRHHASTPEVAVFLRVYIDITRGFVPYKTETFRPDMSDKPVMITEAFDFTEVEDGLFFPMKGKLTMYMPGEDGSLEKIVSSITKASSIKVNTELPPDTFKFDFPAGTEVFDKFTGLTYTVGTTQMHLDDINEFVSRNVETMLTNPLASSEPNSSTGDGPAATGPESATGSELEHLSTHLGSGRGVQLRFLAIGALAGVSVPLVLLFLLRIWRRRAGK